MEAREPRELYRKRTKNLSFMSRNGENRKRGKLRRASAERNPAWIVFHDSSCILFPTRAVELKKWTCKDRRKNKEKDDCRDDTASGWNLLFEN